MKHLIPLLLLFSTVAWGDPTGSTPEEKCSAIRNAGSVRNMNRDELRAKREEVIERYGKSAAAEICASSASLTHEGFKQLLVLAQQKNLEAGGADYDTAELYFFLKCGEQQVNLSPLAYHAFNLNRDDYGFLGEVTQAIVWMSVGYLDTSDPDDDRSFMEAIDRILSWSKKHEAATEVEMYEDLLQQIAGFKEDYTIAAEECRRQP